MYGRRGQGVEGHPPAASPSRSTRAAEQGDYAAARDYIARAIALYDQIGAPCPPELRDALGALHGA